MGCSKNLVDTEHLMRRLELAGYACTHNTATPRGDIAIINTCGFIGDAKEESINTILQFVQRKRRRQLKHLYVMGCLSQRYRKELPEEIPEVDRFFGKFDFTDLIDELEKLRGNIDSGNSQPTCFTERTITTPRHYAYLKIAEGCNRFCTYCAIPLITGRYTSRRIEEIEDEVRWLVRQGVKEFQVIAQDLTYYGNDIYGKCKLPELVERLAHIDGVEWIRLHYAYPTDFPLDLLRVMRENDNVCKYLDLALQHCSDHILRDMHRHITKAEQTALIERIRKEVPGIFLRTTLMVGFPGETDSDFEELLDYTRQMHFERMGAFAYCEEEGTFAQQHFPDDIPEQVKQQRLDRLMELQQQIAAQTNQKLIGKKLKVIIDSADDDYYIARSEFDSPEVDCEILLPKSQHEPLQIGIFYETTITGCEYFDLSGIVEHHTKTK